MKKTKNQPHQTVPWIAVKERKPPVYANVLLAFEHHWNQVVGFYCGDGWYETSADDHNSRCKSKPTWWTPIPQVPHYGWGAKSAQPKSGI